MFGPLEDIKIKSIYHGADLPKPMARCTPDMLNALQGAAADVKTAGGELILSDLYRSYDMQLQAHLDYVTGKKEAFSPPPGGSMHEAGRAFDLDLSALKMKLADFWKIAAKHQLQPIIDTPSAGALEAWHFDCRGSHGLVYDYYAAGKGDNFAKPYTAMAASAIASTGVKVDALGGDPLTGFIQSGLIRLGQEIGDLDGRLGPKSRAGIAALKIDPDASAQSIAAEIAAARPAYRPSQANKAVLGKVVNLLKTAAPISQSFELRPAFLGVLPGQCLYFDSELQLDTDGWPEGKGKGDEDWDPKTSLKYADRKTSLNANAVPYIVLPLPKSWASNRGISLGDYAAVIRKGNVTFAVFGDEGPADKIGEASIQLLRALGEERLKPNGTVINAGTEPGIITIVFPGSGRAADLKDQATLTAAIQSEGARLFKELTT